MNKPKPRVKPDSRVIEVKSLIKDQIKALKILEETLEDVKNDLTLAQCQLNCSIRGKLWTHAKRAGKLLTQLQKKESDLVKAIATTKATIDRLGTKCREIRTLSNNVRRHQASLDKVKSAPVGGYHGIHSNADTIKIYEELVRSAGHKLFAFKI